VKIKEANQPRNEKGGSNNSGAPWKPSNLHKEQYTTREVAEPKEEKWLGGD